MGVISSLMVNKNSLIVFALFLLVLAFPPAAKAEESQEAVLAMAGGPWPPFFMYNEGPDVPHGLFVDLLHAVFTQELGIEIKRHILPWKRAQGEVEAGVADFMVTTPTDVRKKYAVNTAIPLYQLYYTLYTYTGHDKLEEFGKVKTPRDLAGMDVTIAALRGDGWFKKNITDAGVDTHLVNSDEQLPKLVAAKRVDGLIDAELPMDVFIRRHNLQDSIIRTDAKFGPLNFHIQISKKSSLIYRVDEINAALIKLRDNGTFEAIKNKYSQMPY